MGNTFGRRQSTPEELVAAKKFVEEALSANKVVLFGKDWADTCWRAKRVLGTLLTAEQWTLVTISGRPDTVPIQDVLQEMTGARTVPRVFVCGECIGGEDDTTAKAKSGELKKLLIEKGILTAEPA